MTNSFRSPGSRRSPRLQRHASSPGTSDSPHHETFGNNLHRSAERDIAPSSAIILTETLHGSDNPQQHPRRILFHLSVEPVSVSDPVGMRVRPTLFTNTSSMNTVTPGSGGERFGEMDRIAPNSETQRCSDLQTVTPDSQARRLCATTCTAPALERGEGLGLPSPNTSRRLPFSSQPPGENVPTEGGALLSDYEDKNGAEQTRISEANDITGLFGFLSQLSVKRLRVILRSWEWRQRGKEEALVAKAMLQVKLSIVSGTCLSELLSKHEETRRFYSWLRTRLTKDENYPVSIPKLPCEAFLVSLLSAAEASEYSRNKVTAERVRSGMLSESGQPEAATTPQPQDVHEEEHNRNNGEHAVFADSSTHFGISEFARLLIIMRDDEDSKAAAVSMGQVLSRAQLDSGVTRADFWAIVESRYNDPTQDRFLNMVGSVDGVDSRLAPLAHRSATFLKDRFNDAKADSTQYVTRWSASGQNDPERFRNFLPKIANGELNVLGKRMMVMFVCSRKGTPFEEDQFTNLCCKLIPGSAGRDEGSRLGSTAANGVSEQQPRRKRGIPESGGMDEIASSMSRLASVYEARNADKEANQPDKEFKSFSYRLKKIRLSKDVTKEISGLPAVDSEVDGDGENHFMREQLKRLQADVKNNLCTL